ncbi:Shikimate 5-dehydrogenase I alpha [hydrothermal vent metagenome]|uniref:shikimate dehydrogenase (NADP(+)) n=1 Tax=hydrothermal vent metagenome TaxID=652676 RepID=A0A1W1BJL5_9ZZZZ
MRDIFAIFGDPVSHSKSPLMHNLTFRGLEYDGCYGRYRLIDGERLKEKFLQLGLKGINITVPHKEHAYRACDTLDPFAMRVGAVNTIVDRGGRLHGYNTDAPGFLRAISEYTDAKDILLLGAGGTAKSISAILSDEGYDITIVNRGSERLKSFRDDGFKVYTFDDFVPSSYDLIINMTSAGLQDESLPAPKEILEAIVPSAKACVDVIYGKETPFLRLAKSHNRPTKDGSDMLLYQGIIAFQHFTDYRYSFEEIERYMKRAFVD